MPKFTVNVTNKSKSTGMAGIYATVPLGSQQYPLIFASTLMMANTPDTPPIEWNTDTLYLFTSDDQPITNDVMYFDSKTTSFSPSTDIAANLAYGGEHLQFTIVTTTPSSAATAAITGDDSLGTVQGVGAGLGFAGCPFVCAQINGYLTSVLSGVPTAYLITFGEIFVNGWVFDPTSLPASTNLDFSPSNVLNATYNSDGTWTISSS